MASGKPILAAITGETAQFIESTKTGIACSPADPQEIAAAVRKLYNMPAEERKGMGDNGRKIACDYFNRKKMIDAIVAMLSAAVQKA